MADKESSHVKSVARALNLLDVLAESEGEMQLTEIAERLGWPKSTVYGLLATLRDFNYVEQSSGSGRYRLGVRLFELGHSVARSWDVRSIALPVMQKLNGMFGEMVQLATESGGEVLYLEKVDSTHLIRIVSEIGSRLPMHCSGLGKVMLAYRSPAEARRILSMHGMPRMTARTITDYERMETELEKVRSQGYAIDDREIMDGLRCVAAPIWDREGNVRYAMSVSGLAERLSGEYFERVISAVVECAAEISKLFSGMARGYAEGRRDRKSGSV